MEDLIQDILDRQLQDFAGAEVRGRVAIADGVVNEVLQTVTRTAAAAPATAARAGAPEQAAAAGPDIDPQQLLRWLQVNRLAYRTEAGRTILELDVKI
jgi:hypothetical protein